MAGQEPADEPPGALIDLLDARTLVRRQRIVLPPPPGGGIAGASPVFTADGRGLIVLQIPFSYQPQRVFRHRRGPRRRRRPPVPLPRQRERPASRGDRSRVFVSSAEEDVTYELDMSEPERDCSASRPAEQASR